MQNNNETVVAKTISRFKTFRYYLVLEGIGVGIFSGLIIVLFRLILEHANDFLHSVLATAKGNPIFIIFWFLALLVAAFSVWALLKWEPLISGSGIPQVEGELHGHIDQKWWRVLIAKLVGGVISIGAGLSLGREGPSIQLGAMVGKGFSKITKRMKTEEKMLITCGAGSGLAAAFNAPLAGVLFSLEELHKNFSVDVLLSTMASCCTADFISRYVFGLKPVFQFEIVEMLPLKYYGYVILLGVITGLFGVIYNKFVEKSQNLYSKIKHSSIKIVIPFMLAGILGFIYPHVLGGGHELVEQLNNKSFTVYALLILLIIKFLFSMISFGSGSPGGIFLPLLVMGAIVGTLFCSTIPVLFNTEFNLLPYFIILGMAGFFSAIVRAPITGIILISEMTGSFSNLFTLSLVSLTAYIVADLLKSQPIYEQLLHRILLKYKNVKKHETGEKILVESLIYHGSKAENNKISEINWPKSCLVVSIMRSDAEFVPNGETVLKAGDKIVILCDEIVAPNAYRLLEEECATVFM